MKSLDYAEQRMHQRIAAAARKHAEMSPRARELMIANGFTPARPDTLADYFQKGSPTYLSDIRWVYTLVQQDFDNELIRKAIEHVIRYREHGVYPHL